MYTELRVAPRQTFFWPQSAYRFYFSLFTFRRALTWEMACSAMRSVVWLFKLKKKSFFLSFFFFYFFTIIFFFCSFFILLFAQIKRGKLFCLFFAPPVGTAKVGIIHTYVYVYICIFMHIYVYGEMPPCVNSCCARYSYICTYTVRLKKCIFPTIYLYAVRIVKIFFWNCRAAFCYAYNALQYNPYADKPLMGGGSLFGAPSPFGVRHI